jgi:hypothetical protein
MEDNNYTINKNINTDIHEECIELKNIKYKTMLINGVNINETKTSQNLQNLDKFLEDEKNVNENEPWCKLNKTIKIKKLMEYVEIYKKDLSLNEEESEKLIHFFKDCLDRKKLQRIKDVIYDKENGTIKEIPALTYIKATKHFTLKNIEKRVSTAKSLPPKKSNIHGTIKNKNNNKSTSKIEDCSSDDEKV